MFTYFDWHLCVCECNKYKSDRRLMLAEYRRQTWNGITAIMLSQFDSLLCLFNCKKKVFAGLSNAILTLDQEHFVAIVDFFFFFFWRGGMP